MHSKCETKFISKLESSSFDRSAGEFYIVIILYNSNPKWTTNHYLFFPFIYKVDHGVNQGIVSMFDTDLDNVCVAQI